MAPQYGDSMKIKIIILFILQLFIFSQSYAESSNDVLFKQQLSATEELIKNTEKKAPLWRDTKNLINQANNLAASNEFELAIKLLEKAQFQAEQSYQQALDQSNTEELLPFYLRP